MTGTIQGAAVTAAGRPDEGWSDDSRGDATWVTLFSSDRTPTSDLCAGVMRLGPGTIGLKRHRHDQAELYFITEGEGVVTIDGVEIPVAPSVAVFIPGNAEHALRNTGSSPLNVFYVFPTGRFSDVVYRFPEA